MIRRQLLVCERIIAKNRLTIDTLKYNGKFNRINQFYGNRFSSGVASSDSAPIEAPPTARSTRTTTKQSLRRVTSQRDYPNRLKYLISEERPIQPCVGLSTADSYDLPKVIEILHSQGHLQASMLLPHEVAYAKYPLGNGHKADAFILSNGSIVTFGMSEIDTIRFADELLTAEIRSYPLRESEDMDYIELPEDPDDIHDTRNNHQDGEVKRSFMDGETIYITGNDRIMDKAAFASGLARSTKLAVLEMGLERYLENVKDITDQLATGRKLKMNSGKHALKQTGELLRLRGNLNLYSELTETPDLYWSEPELESMYRAISKNLDIAPRIAILNKKLDYVSEVVSILKAHLSEVQSVRLEWMIIILIMVEVAFESFHFAERYLDWLDKSVAKDQSTERRQENTAA
ncbi:hypothetical protein V1512DRAFT_260665 [Lipomyces arxii]|uniref:uncharacterized protein n=1 Tax=Lipomyces arxii TaxID=56418 RepID=UPI0034CD7AA8